MIVFEGLIAVAAKKAGMKTPPEEQLDVKVGGWDKKDYPHFFVFCNLQLGRSMSSPNQHWENAKVIAAIPEEKLKTMTVEDFVAAGVDIS